MLVSAQQVADTLGLLVPGFILVKVFYLFGLQTKRSDAQWVIWSILASAPIAGFTSFIARGFGPNVVLVLSVLFALTSGVLLSLAWKWIAGRWPDLLARQLIRSWDVVLSPQQRWLQIELVDGRVFVGKQESVALSVDTDDLNLYLIDVRQPNGEILEPIEGVDGLLVQRADIRLIAVLHDPPSPPGVFSPSRSAAPF
jgi:hypothetical protein